jgi:hypothetical protein
VYQQAVMAGGNTIMEPMNMFYGARNGGMKDSSGNSWKGRPGAAGTGEARSRMPALSPYYPE